MQFPIIHLNGSSGKLLLESALDVKEALHQLGEVLKTAAPHSRDYYLCSNTDSFARACAEHQDRVSMLVRIAADYKLIIENLDSQLEY